MGRIIKPTLFLGVIAGAAYLTLVLAQGGGSSVPRMSVGGTPHEIGYQVGRAHARSIQRNVTMLYDVAHKETGATRDQVDAEVARLARHLHPHDLEELRGLAQGSGVREQEALLLNMFYHLGHSRVACRQLAAWDQATSNGNLLHGRNLDWNDYPGEPLQRENLILNVKPATGHEYLLLTWPGVQGALTGANRPGLTLAFNRLGGANTPGEPIFLVLRRILQTCDNLDDAVSLLRRTRTMGNGSVLIAHGPTRRAVVVEIVGEQVGVREGQDMIGNANHATPETGLRGVPIDRADAPMCDLARERGGPLTPKDMTALLADPRVMANNTLLSVVFEPQANRMLVACGRLRAAEGPFETYTMFQGR